MIIEASSPDLCEYQSDFSIERQVQSSQAAHRMAYYIDCVLDGVNSDTLTVLRGHGMGGQKTTLRRLMTEVSEEEIWSVDPKGKDFPLTTIFTFMDDDFFKRDINPYGRMRVRSAAANFLSRVKAIDPMYRHESGFSLLPFTNGQKNVLQANGVTFRKILAYSDETLLRQLSITRGELISEYRPQLADNMWKYLQNVSWRVDAPWLKKKAAQRDNPKPMLQVDKNLSIVMP